MKKNMFQYTLPVIFLCAGGLLLTQDAHAYIDPGAGTYIIQLILAGIVGAAFTIKTFWLRIKMFFSKLFFDKK